MSHSGGNKAKAISVKGNLVWKESNSIVCHVVMMNDNFISLSLRNQNPDDHPQPGCDHNDISEHARKESVAKRTTITVTTATHRAQTLFYATLKAVIISCQLSPL